MLFQLFAPQGLKCPAAAIQRLDFGEIGKFAQQITKINFTGGHTRIFGHFSLLKNTKPEYYFEIRRYDSNILFTAEAQRTQRDYFLYLSVRGRQMQILEHFVLFYT